MIQKNVYKIILILILPIVLVDSYVLHAKKAKKDDTLNLKENLRKEFNINFIPIEKMEGLVDIFYKNYFPKIKDKIIIKNEWGFKLDLLIKYADILALIPNNYTVKLPYGIEFSNNNLSLKTNIFSIIEKETQKKNNLNFDYLESLGNFHLFTKIFFKKMVFYKDYISKEMEEYFLRSKFLKQIVNKLGFSNYSNIKINAWDWNQEILEYLRDSNQINFLLKKEKDFLVLEVEYTQYNPNYIQVREGDFSILDALVKGIGPMESKASSKVFEALKNQIKAESTGIDSEKYVNNFDMSVSELAKVGQKNIDKNVYKEKDRVYLLNFGKQLAENLYEAYKEEIVKKHSKLINLLKEVENQLTLQELYRMKNDDYYAELKWEGIFDLILTEILEHNPNYLKTKDQEANSLYGFLIDRFSQEQKISNVDERWYLKNVKDFYKAWNQELENSIKLKLLKYEKTSYLRFLYKESRYQQIKNLLEHIANNFAENSVINPILNLQIKGNEEPNSPNKKEITVSIIFPIELNPSEIMKESSSLLHGYPGDQFGILNPVELILLREALDRANFLEYSYPVKIQKGNLDAQSKPIYEVALNGVVIASDSSSKMVPLLANYIQLPTATSYNLFYKLGDFFKKHLVSPEIKYAHFVDLGVKKKSGFMIVFEEITINGIL